MDRVGKVAYQLDLPDKLSQIHSTFHVTLLRKCVVDDLVVILLNDIRVDEDPSYLERPVAILDTKTKTLRNKVVPLVNV